MHTIALPLNRIEESSRQTILRGGVLHIDTDHAQDTALLICEALDALPPEVLCLAVGGCLNLQRAAVRATLDRLGSADGREDLHDAIWCPQLIICDRLEDETGRTIKWEDAMKWRTVQDVLDFLEAREEKLFGDLPAGA